MNPCPDACKDNTPDRLLAYRQRALKMAGEHLRHAGLSHARACALQDKGLHPQAHEQSRMTQVFLNNALHHLQGHAQTSA